MINIIPIHTNPYDNLSFFSAKDSLSSVKIGSMEYFCPYNPLQYCYTTMNKFVMGASSYRFICG